jgi:CRP/FNR family transcriptional regulator, dissimilatory nitrate respiration regulator
MEEKLLTCPLFLGIPMEGLVALLQQVESKLLHFAKNDVVVVENGLCNRLLIVMEGSVRGEMTDFSGKVIKIEDIGACRPLAPAFLFGNKNRYPVSIVANEKTVLLSFTQETTLKMFQLDRFFLLNFLNMISNRAQFLSQKIKFLSFQTIKGKLAPLLVAIGSRKAIERNCAAWFPARAVGIVWRCPAIVGARHPRNSR